MMKPTANAAIQVPIQRLRMNGDRSLAGGGKPSRLI